MSFERVIDRCFNRRPRMRRWITRLLEGDRDLTVRLLSADVRINSIKEHGYLRASRLSRFNSLLRDELPVLQSLSYLLGGADAFVDVGANVGVYCAVLAKLRRLNPVPFYAFEANPDTYRRLVETTAGLAVETFNLAVSDREGTLDFVPGAVSHVFTTVDRVSGYSLPAPPVRIACRRLDAFPLRGSRMIVKIDVEGQEMNVVRGMGAFLEQGRVFACYVDGYGERGLPGLLREHGFRLLDGRTLEARPDGDCHALLALRD
ncbi:MAG: FkbM family methyltransferase [Opitutaceae bacterium]